MIEYDSTECFGLAIVFSLAGSVVPRNIPQGFIAAILTLLISSIAGDNPEPLSSSPYGERVMGTVLGLMLVFRSAFALRRFWEARSFLAKCTSMLADIGRDGKSFSVKNRSAPSPDSIEFQSRIARLLRLCLCVMFQNLTGETDINDWKAHEYLEEHEKVQLKLDARTRPYIVLTWVAQSFFDLHCAGLLAVPPPALNNVLREVADSNLFYNQALKIADTQFPFPMIQMSKVLLGFFIVVTPMVLGRNAGDPSLNALLAFIVVLAFFSVDAIATELSDPFGFDDNDLPLHDIMEELNKYLSIVLPRQAASKPPMVPPQGKVISAEPSMPAEDAHRLFLQRNKDRIDEVLRMSHQQELRHRISLHSQQLR